MKTNLTYNSSAAPQLNCTDTALKRYLFTPHAST